MLDSILMHKKSIRSNYLLGNYYHNIHFQKIQVKWACRLFSIAGLFRLQQYINPLNIKFALLPNVRSHSILPHQRHLKYTYYIIVLGHFCVSKLFTSKMIVNTKLWPEEQVSHLSCIQTLLYMLSLCNISAFPYSNTQEGQRRDTWCLLTVQRSQLYQLKELLKLHW